MSELWTRARRAARTAELALRDGDADGAINRAYFAVFDVARAVLLAAAPDESESKTHASVLRKLSRVLVKELGYDADLARGFRRLFEWRAESDYEQSSSLARAEEALQIMRRIMETLSHLEGAPEK